MFGSFHPAEMSVESQKSWSSCVGCRKTRITRLPLKFASTMSSVASITQSRFPADHMGRARRPAMQVSVLSSV